MMFLESMNNQLESKIQKLQKTMPTKPKQSRTLILDEHLNKHIEKIIKKNSKKAKIQTVIEKKSFFARLFFR